MCTWEPHDNSPKARAFASPELLGSFYSSTNCTTLSSTSKVNEAPVTVINGK